MVLELSTKAELDRVLKRNFGSTTTFVHFHYHFGRRRSSAAASTSPFATPPKRPSRSKPKPSRLPIEAVFEELARVVPATFVRVDCSDGIGISSEWTRAGVRAPHSPFHSHLHSRLAQPSCTALLHCSARRAERVHACR